MILLVESCVSFSDTGLKGDNSGVKLGNLGVRPADEVKTGIPVLVDMSEEFFKGGWVPRRAVTGRRLLYLK